MADTVDVDYDTISHTLTFTARWSRPPAVLYDPLSGNITENAWSLIVDSSRSAEKVEVGVLSNEIPTDQSEINLSGFLTVVGEDDRPKPTLFSFPSRHHALPPSQAEDQKYTISFLQPTGLHPTMQISFPSTSALKPPNNRHPESICALHTYLTLPSPLFADKYQLSPTDTLFLQSHNLIALRSISGETDLEAPDYVVKRWGSNLLLELAVPAYNSSTPSSSSTTPDKPADAASGGWNTTIPLHLRYLPPSPTGKSTIEIPNPIVFWACTADEGANFPVNPFDRVNLGYEGLFGGRTMFYHLDPAAHVVGRGESGEKAEDAKGRLVQKLLVPVLDTEGWGAEAVEWATVVAVLVGFAWVVWKLWVGSSGLRAEPRGQKKKSGEEKREGKDKDKEVKGEEKKKKKKKKKKQ